MLTDEKKSNVALILCSLGTFKIHVHLVLPSKFCNDWKAFSPEVSKVPPHSAMAFGKSKHVKTRKNWRVIFSALFHFILKLKINWRIRKRLPNVSKYTIKVISLAEFPVLHFYIKQRFCKRQGWILFLCISIVIFTFT